MRTEQEVRQKLKQVQFRHLKKLIEQSYKKRPCNCRHNEIHGAMSHKEGEEPIGICMWGADDPVEWTGNICDEMFEGLKVARECGLFEPRKTKVEIKADFHSLMTEGDIGAVGSQFPDLAALMWVLDERPYRPTLWQRFLLWCQPAHILPIDENEGAADEESNSAE